MLHLGDICVTFRSLRVCFLTVSKCENTEVFRKKCVCSYNLLHHMKQVSCYATFLSCLLPVLVKGAVQLLIWIYQAFYLYFIFWFWHLDVTLVVSACLECITSLGDGVFIPSGTGLAENVTIKWGHMGSVEKNMNIDTFILINFYIIST